MLITGMCGDCNISSYIITSETSVQSFMKVGFLQYRVQFGDAEANRRKIVSLLKKELFDLLVLPELALTGYFMPSRQAAFDMAE